MRYSLRTNIIGEKEIEKKIIVSEEVDLNEEMRQRLRAQLDYIQKCLDTNKILSEKIKKVKAKEPGRTGETRRGEYKTLIAAQKAQKEGEHIDYFDGTDWHEDVKQELNGGKGSK